MLTALVAITLLIASVGAIYYLLKSMGQDGIEVAAPGSCKSGRCGVRKVAGDQAGCRQAEDARFVEGGELIEVAAAERDDAPVEQPGNRLG